MVINPEKSNLIPSQVVQYLGVVINAQSFVASPSPDRISSCYQPPENFDPPPRLPQVSGCLCWGCFPHWLTWFLEADRVQSLQLCLNKSWDHVDLSSPVAWSGECLQDLQWWLHLPRLSQGVSLRQVSPDLDYWSDASDAGWGAHLGPLVASGLWDLEQASMPINSRELLAIQHGLLHFQLSLCGRTVAVFCDNVTAVVYLRKEGGTRSPLLNTIAQGILRWSELLAIRLASQFIPDSNNVLADALSRPHQLPHSEWSLNRVSEFVSSVAGADRFVCDLRKSPMLDLFSSLPRPSVCGHGRIPLVLGLSSGLCLSSVCHHSQRPCETSGVSGDGAHPCGSALGAALLVSRPPPAVASPSRDPSRSSRPPAPASVSAPLPGSPQATASCLETLRRFTRAAGFSSAVAEQASLARRPSSLAGYQLR